MCCISSILKLNNRPKFFHSLFLFYFVVRFGISCDSHFTELKTNNKNDRKTQNKSEKRVRKNAIRIEYAIDNEGVEPH